MSNGHIGKGATPGSRAVVVGLKRADLNGLRCTLKCFVHDRERWSVVREDNGETLGVKPESLVAESMGCLPHAIALAAAADEGAVVRRWLETGGDIDAPSRQDVGATLLMRACSGGCAALAGELIDRNADIDARDDNGSTALHHALEHTPILRQLLSAGALTHLRTGGSAEQTKGILGGNALEHAEHRGLEEAAALLRKHENAAQDESEPPRDVFDKEREVLMRVLAAELLTQQTRLGDFMNVERDRYMERMVTTAFGDPRDVAALSRRFAKHGADQLSLKVWSAAAQADSEVLARIPRFQQIASEVSDGLPGLAEMLNTYAHSEMNVMKRAPEEED